MFDSLSQLFPDFAMRTLPVKTFRTFKTSRENTIWLVGESLHLNRIVALLVWSSGS